MVGFGVCGVVGRRKVWRPKLEGAKKGEGWDNGEDCSRFPWIDNVRSIELKFDMRLGERKNLGLHKLEK